MTRLIKTTSIRAQAYCWLGVPAVLFLLGWVRWYVSLPLSALLIYAMISDLRDERAAHGDASPLGGERRAHWQPVAMDRMWWWSVALIPLVVILLGTGGFFPQHYDYWWRNAIFFDLVRHDWPMVYDGASPRYFCYYMAYWLPAALVGKAFGLILPGDLALIVWGWWGIAIALNLLTSYFGGKCRWWFLPLMLTFGFLDRTVCFLFTESITGFFGVDHIDKIFSNYHSMSMAEQFMCIFNQSLPLWVALPLIWRERNNAGRLILPCSLLFLFSPLPCVGIALPVLWCLCKKIRQSFTLSNLIGLLFLGVVGIYFLANANTASVGASVITSPGRIFIYSILFYLIPIGVCLPFVGRRLLRNPIFWMMFSVCWALPFIMMGGSDDLGRRAMLPLTIMLSYCIIGAFTRFKTLTRLKRIWLAVITLLGIIGTGNIVAVINRSWHSDAIMHGKIKKVTLMGRLDDPEANIYYHNFISSDTTSLYYRYLMPSDAKRSCLSEGADEAE